MTQDSRLLPPQSTRIRLCLDDDNRSWSINLTWLTSITIIDIFSYIFLSNCNFLPLFNKKPEWKVIRSLQKSLSLVIALYTWFMSQNKGEVWNVSYHGKAPGWLFASVFDWETGQAILTQYHCPLWARAGHSCPSLINDGSPFDLKSQVATQMHQQNRYDEKLSEKFKVKVNIYKDFQYLKRPENSIFCRPASLTILPKHLLAYFVKSNWSKKVNYLDI